MAALVSEIGGWLFWLGVWGQSHPFVILIAFGIIMACGLVLKVIVGRGTHQESIAHGSARWATKSEIRRAGLFQMRGVILGHAHGRYLRHDGPEHVMLVGPTRSGKGVSTIIPTLLTWRESVLVTDPKDGENADVTWRWRERLGPVWVFAPRRLDTTRIDVLQTIRLGTPQEFGDAYLIAQSHVAPEKLVRENQTSLHFRELAALLHAAVYLHVLYAWPRKSMAGVWEFMTQAHESLASCLKVMAGTRHHSAGVHQAIASMTRAIQNITGDRELSSVWSTAIRPLVPYSDPLIAAATDTSDVDLNELQYGERPVSLYLVAPSPMELERLHPIYRVILDVVMMRLMEHKVRTWRHRLLHIYDEMPAYGYTRVVEKGIPVMAGYGMKGLLVTQDLDSLWDVYGEHTQIWGNCRVKIFHPPDNDLTAKRISENLLGQGTQGYATTQQTPIVGYRRSVTLQQHARPLLTPDEVMTLPAHQEIVRVGGLHPILAEKCDYRSDRHLQGRAA